MKLTLSIIALFQIAAGLVLGTIILFLWFFLIRLLMKRLYKIDSFNTSFAILTAAIIFSAGIFLKSVIEPITTTFRLLTNTDTTLLNIILTGSLYMLAYFAMATIFSSIIITIALILFTFLTRKVDEIQEIKKDNIAIGIILSVVVVVLSLLVVDGFMLLIDSIIPFPAIPKSVG